MTDKKKQKSKTSSRKPTEALGIEDVSELIPRLRIDSALRNRLRMPLTKEYVDTVHVSIDHTARFLLAMISDKSLISFNARNQLMQEYGRRPKARMDIGAMAGLYMEVPADVGELVESIAPQVRLLVERMGVQRSMQLLLDVMAE
jgi:hypothetical protein